MKRFLIFLSKKCEALQILEMRFLPYLGGHLGFVLTSLNGWAKHKSAFLSAGGYLNYQHIPAALCLLFLFSMAELLPTSESSRFTNATVNEKDSLSTCL